MTNLENKAKVVKTRLRNGLEVRLKEIHNAPLISSWVWYRVGSRNERTGQTGISHWVEHMQFKGTPKHPGDILDRVVSRGGGVWNAFTCWIGLPTMKPCQRIALISPSILRLIEW